MPRKDDREDTPSQRLFAAWRRDEAAAESALRRAGEDLADPAYLEAEARARQALWAFLCQPTASLLGVLRKLEIACHYEDYAREALDPASRLVSPRAILAARQDLEHLVLAAGQDEAVDREPGTSWNCSDG